MIKKVDHPSRKAGSPIRLDKGAIKRFAKYLSGRILKDLTGDFASDSPISDTGRGYLINDMITIQDVLGNDVKTLVLVKSEIAAKRLGMIIGGGAGTTPIGEQAVQINLNGSWTPAEFSEPSSFGRQNLPKELFSILLHELTHIADIFKKSGPTTRRVLREDELDLEEYYNRPAEVKAYMQDVADEVVSNLPTVKKVYERAERDVSFNKMIKQSLVLSDTWERIEPYLSRQNKKKIMSAVYREAKYWQDDVGYL